MVVRLRLARYGAANLPFYRIVAADSRFKRDGRFLEQLGTYDPIPDKTGSKNVRLKVERTKYWIGVGAQPSDAVGKLLARFNLFPTVPYQNITPIENVPTNERPKLEIPEFPKMHTTLERH